MRSPSALRTGQWTHLALTYDGSTQKLYVDGVLVSSAPPTGPVPTPDGGLTIGGNTNWGEGFAGAIDEVRVYGRALSATEVAGVRTTAVSGATIVP